MKTKKLTESLYWIGNLDPDLKIFDIVMQTEYGTSYNSYLLKDSYMLSTSILSEPLIS